MKWSYYPSVIVLIMLGVLTWLLMSGLNLNSPRFDSELKALDDFLRFERALNREVLTARVGLSRNYDALVRITAKAQELLRRLRAAAGPHPDEIAAIDVLERRAGRETELIEQFKTKNALLQNSMAYFGVLTTRLVASNYKPVANAATKLAGAMLLLTMDTSKAAVDRVQDRLGDFAMLERLPGDDESVSAVLAHGRMLVDVLPDIDAILKALIVETDNREQDVVRALIVQRQLASRATARRYRLSLYITSLVLLVSLVILGLQLRKRALALRRQAAFEHVIADISMRFINSQHHELAAHVESALEKLAEFIGADRAYFVVAKHSSIYQWAREEVGI